MRRAVMLGLSALAGLFAQPGAAQALNVPAFKDGTDVHVARVQRVSNRLFELTLTTPLLTAPTRVRVLLPEGYDANRRKRYPVLYLFHGTSGGARDWTAKPGRAQDITAGKPLITVMPDAGVNDNGGSWFTDWHNNGAFGPPRWETWHVERLLPWIDSQLRTIPTRQQRAIAGLSQGGFGAMSYGARHPDLFSSAISFSGALDIAAYPAESRPVIDPVIAATEVGLVGVPLNTFFGPRSTNEINWQAHDPATLAGNLGNTRVAAYTGNGQPGPLDGADNPYSPPGAAIEAGARQLTLLFARAAKEQGVPIELSDYGGGTHTWPYWERDLREAIGPLMASFAKPRPAPARIDFTTDANGYRQWGWQVDIARPGREFSTLGAASKSGFSLRGTGRAQVATPPRYLPGGKARITRKGPGVDDVSRPSVSRDGRLRIGVPLGATGAAQTTSVAIAAPLCTSRGNARYRLPLRTRVTRTAILVNGRVTRVLRGRRRSVRVDLRGRAPARYRVAIRVRGRRDGRTVRRTLRRSLRVCPAQD